MRFRVQIKVIALIIMLIQTITHFALTFSTNGGIFYNDRDHTYMTSTLRGVAQKNSPQIADTGTFKVRNWAKIADGGGVQF